MQSNKVILVRTLAASQFRGALAQHAIATLDLDPVQGGGSALGPHAECHIEAISILSAQNLAWEIYLYRRSTFNQAAIDDNYLAGRHVFAATDGLQIAATGPFLYYTSNVNIPYWDEEPRNSTVPQGRIHLGLVNRSVTGKSADDAGAISIRLICSPGFGGI
jgi:hypothetical protein